MSYPKELIIGFGTGRCGSKSLASFLNRQPEIAFTHEGAAITFWPFLGGYRKALDKVMSYDAPIVGDISPNWIMYLDRLVEDVPSVKFIYLTRGNTVEVASSFFEYMRFRPEAQYDCHGMYPVHAREFNIKNIHRCIERYEWMAKLAERQWAADMRMMKLYMSDLSQHQAQVEILDWLKYPNEGRSYHMPHINKMEYMIKKTMKGEL